MPSFADLVTSRVFPIRIGWSSHKFEDDRLYYRTHVDNTGNCTLLVWSQECWSGRSIQTLETSWDTDRVSRWWGCCEGWTQSLWNSKNHGNVHNPTPFGLLHHWPKTYFTLKIYTTNMCHWSRNTNSSLHRWCTHLTYICLYRPAKKKKPQGYCNVKYINVDNFKVK